MTVDGRSAAARGGLRTIQVALTAGGGVFNHAILTSGDLTWGASVVDSWDSRVGGYAASNCVTLGVTCDGDLGSEAALSVTAGSGKGGAGGGGGLGGCPAARSPPRGAPPGRDHRG